MVNTVNIIKVIDGNEVDATCSACGYRFAWKEVYDDKQCPRCSAPFKNFGKSFWELEEYKLEKVNGKNKYVKCDN